MPNTINTGTRLIEEIAFLPESVRSESKAWTSFYMAGELIRELRKAQENKRVSVPGNEKWHEEGGLKDRQLQR
jgi:hypothetical protein